MAETTSNQDSQELEDLRRERALLVRIMDLSGRLVTLALFDPTRADDPIVQAAKAAMDKWRDEFGYPAELRKEAKAIAEGRQL